MDNSLVWSPSPAQFVEALTNEPTWFDRSARPKTYDAISKLSKRMSKRERERIPSSILVFAPSPTCHGAAGYLYSRLNETKEVFVYLSPLLEKMPQAEVDSVIAHEFAHVVLGHLGSFVQTDPGEDPDKAVDRLVKRWRFTAAYSRKKLAAQAP